MRPLYPWWNVPSSPPEESGSYLYKADEQTVQFWTRLDSVCYCRNAGWTGRQNVQKEGSSLQVYLQNFVYDQSIGRFPGSYGTLR